MTNEKDDNHKAILDEVDIEEEAKAGRDVRRARRYRIRIDKERHVTEQEIVTGRYVLGLVGKTPEAYLLSLRVRGGHVEEIEADEKVDLRKRGVERFMTLKRDPQEGYAEMRKQFQLPESDVEHLDTRGLPWEAVVEGGSQWLLVHDFPVPAGYNVAAVIVALLIAPGYPDAQIDMAYFFPALARADGKAIPQITEQSIDGKSYQRWSRHRTDQDPWRVGVDDIGTHLVQVAEWLRRELRLR
jgi:hypothetical protein